MPAPIKRILTEADMEKIRVSALRVLDEVGILCAHQKAAAMLVDRGGVRYENGRLFFNRDSMEEFLLELRRETLKREAEAAQPDFTLTGHWNCLELCDPETNMPRPATVAEAESMAKLSAAMGMGNNPIPVSPGTVNPRLRTLECERIALTHTPGHGGKLTATDNDEIRILSDMNRAAGRRYTLGLEGLITPLKLNPYVFDLYFQWCDEPDVDIEVMGGIPVAGSTAPLVFPACLALPLAEALALDFLFKSLSRGKLRNFYLRLDVFDMRWTNLAFGTPEHCLILQALCELREGLLGMKTRNGSFRTNGKCIEAQAMLERTASFLWQASYGARLFGAVGQMSMDEVFSPVQAVLDREIMEYGKRAFAGVGAGCWDRERDIVEIIREGVEDSGFLVHDTTVGTFRSFFGFGRLSEASNLNGWRNRGAVRMEQKAWAEAQALIKAYDFHLDEQAQRDVDKLYRKGIELLTASR